MRIFFKVFVLILITSLILYGQEKIIKALEKGDINSVKKMIEKGVDVDTRVMRGWQESPGGPTLLMLTACGDDCGVKLTPQSQLSLFKYLIKKGASINAKTSNNETVLTYAVHGPHDIESEEKTKGGESLLEMVRFLLVKGAEINFRDDMGYSPLMYASESGYHKIVRVLLENGAREGLIESLESASYQGHKETRNILKLWFREIERSVKFNDSIPINRDNLIADLNSIGNYAQQYYRKPTSMGGGGNSFRGWKIPPALKNTDHGSFYILSIDLDEVIVVGIGTEIGVDIINKVKIKATILKDSMSINALN